MPRRQAIADRWRARFKADDEPLPPLGDVFEWPSIRELIYGGHGQHADMEDEATQTKEGEDEVVLTDEAIDAALDEFEQMVPECVFPTRYLE